VGIIYGLIALFLASLCVGVTLSELGSAYPNSGGQYYWTSQLAPRSTRRLLAYVTGYLSWAGAIFTSVSVAIAVGQGIVGMVQYNHPELVIDRWMVFLTAELVNVAAALFNLYSKFLPTIATVSLYVTLSGFIVTFVTVMASSSGKYNSSEFVFAQFVNETGWSNDAVAVIVGLINPSWAFPCLVSTLKLQTFGLDLTLTLVEGCSNASCRRVRETGARDSDCHHGNGCHWVFHVSKGSNRYLIRTFS
jgi:choline transport protein